MVLLIIFFKEASNGELSSRRDFEEDKVFKTIIFAYMLCSLITFLLSATWIESLNNRDFVLVCTVYYFLSS